MLRVEGPAAIEIQHLSAVILERINRFFGWQAIGRIALRQAPLLMEFDRAIAFDRKGLGDVITHQGWSRCCSDEFAQALAHALTTDTMWMLPDDTGVYTDTAEFVDLIPECTNISVGYSGAHGPQESLNVAYLERLADAATQIDWDALPTTRDPAASDSVYDSWGEWYGSKEQHDYTLEEFGFTRERIESAFAGYLERYGGMI